MTDISILSMYIVHSNHGNAIVGVFVCSVYFILSVYPPPVSAFLFISYAISRGALDDAPRSTMAPKSPGVNVLNDPLDSSYPLGFFDNFTPTILQQS